MNDKHTPGPWTYAVANHDHTECEHAFYILSVRRPFVATVLGGADPGRSEAHARLIAAAPTLLKALQELHAEYEQVTGLGWTDARIALAEATGEEAPQP